MSIILTNDDIDHHMKINRHILNRLKKATITIIPEKIEFRKDAYGIPVPKITPERYLVRSSYRIIPRSISRGDIVHRNLPYCRICDKEFESGDEVYATKTKVTSEAEASRIGGRMRTRWLHVDCVDPLEDYEPVEKKAHLRGARGLLVWLVPERNDKEEWVTEDELFKNVAKFFQEDRKPTIQGQIDSFINKYRDKLIIETTKTGIKQYQWKDKRAWQNKKDRLKFNDYLKRF